MKLSVRWHPDNSFNCIYQMSASYTLHQLLNLYCTTMWITRSINIQQWKFLENFSDSLPCCIYHDMFWYKFPQFLPLFLSRVLISPSSVHKYAWESDQPQGTQHCLRILWLNIFKIAAKFTYVGLSGTLKFAVALIFSVTNLRPDGRSCD